jgi:hypothetical protein
MTDPADFETWLATHPPPSLQNLVTTHNGWPNIPAEAWAKYVSATAQWEAARRDRLLGSRTWAMMEGKKYR